MVFSWSLGDAKSPEVFKICLIILVDLNKAKEWILLLISNYSHIPTLSRPLGTVPSAPITNCKTDTLIFLNFPISLARSKYLSLFLLSLIFIQWSAGTAKSTVRQVLYLC